MARAPAIMKLPAPLGERFRDPEVLGVGSFAVVLKAIDPARGEPVALKLESPSELLAPELRENLRGRFAREAELSGRIDHPNVIRMLEHGVAGDQAYIVYEYFEGMDLQEAQTRRHGGFAPDEAIHLAKMILEGLAAAHSLGVQHRDLKPANVLLGKDGRLKLADFGLARAPDSQTLTIKGVHAGTPVYTAPEVFRGKAPDMASDVYSFGILFLELLLDGHPFPTDSLMGIFRAKSEWTGPDWGDRRRLIPASLRELVEACTQADPATRPPTAVEVLAEFRRACEERMLTSGEIRVARFTSQGMPTRAEREARLAPDLATRSAFTRLGERQLLLVSAGVSLALIGLLLYLIL